jgi:hypothetical protein
MKNLLQDGKQCHGNENPCDIKFELFTRHEGGLCNGVGKVTPETLEQE